MKGLNKNMPPKILIVDDEPDILEFIKYLLEREDYQVETASNGTEAILKSKSFKPELILMDVMMPVMDGIEACRQIKLHPETQVTMLTIIRDVYTLSKNELTLIITLLRENLKEGNADDEDNEEWED